MDVLVLMTATLAGGIALGWSACRPQAAVWQVLLSWPAMAWLCIYFVKLAWGMGDVDVTHWTGSAEMGPATLVVICVGLSWLWLGASENANQR